MVYVILGLLLISNLMAIGLGIWGLGVAKGWWS